MGSTKTIKLNANIGLCNLLTVLFVGLKLTDHINWSWWLVLAPTLIPAAIGLSFLTLVLSMAVFAAVLKK